VLRKLVKRERADKKEGGEKGIKTSLPCLKNPLFTVVGVKTHPAQKKKLKKKYRHGGGGYFT